MKKYLLLLSSAVILFTFSSCDKDDPKPDYFIGTWNIDKEELSNLPTDFKVWERVYDLSSAYDKYIFKADKTYSWETRIQGLVFTDEGTWSKTSEKYVLKSDKGTDDTEFELDQNNQLHVTYSTKINLPDPNDETQAVEVDATIKDTYVKEVK
jgi:hypothetical protein